MSTVGKLSGIILSPAETALAIRERPAWLVAFALTAVLLIISLSLEHSLLVSMIADSIEKSARENPQSAEALEKIISVLQGEANEPSAVGRLIMVAFVLGIVLVGSVLVYSLILHGMARALGGQGTWRGSLALVSHGRIINPGLGDLALLPLALGKGTLVGVTLSLAALFPQLEPGGIPYRLVSMFSLFGIWFFIVMVLGLEKIYGLGRGRAIAAAAVPYVIGALVSGGAG